MGIYRRLNLDLKKRGILSFVGGGGKSTTIYRLGNELKGLGKRVLITTTTRIFNPTEKEYDNYFLKYITPSYIPRKGTITVFGEGVKNCKMLGISLDKLDKLIQDKKYNFDFIIIEADGSNGKSIKAPSECEPVISDLTSETIGMIGIDCLYKKIEEVVQRPEIFINLVERNYADIIDEEVIVRLVLDNKGLFKNAKGRKILILNKINVITLKIGKNIRNTLLDNGFDGDIILGDIIKEKFY